MACLLTLIKDYTNGPVHHVLAAQFLLSRPAGCNSVEWKDAAGISEAIVIDVHAVQEVSLRAGRCYCCMERAESQ